MKSKARLFAAAIGLLALSGCNTIAGFGQDITGAAYAIGDRFEMVCHCRGPDLDRGLHACATGG